jgi:L-lactate dehydrogenase complex protein LldE
VSNTVQLFVTCIVDALYPETGEAVVRVLQRSGCSVEFPRGQTCCGSCTGMVKHGYGELFADDPEWLPRAQGIADRTYEFSEYLVDELGLDDIGTEYSDKITYHSSCHLLRDLGIDEQPQRLLINIQGTEIIPLPKREECCGFGGLFSIEHPEISKAMLDRKIENFITSGAAVLVSCDAGCVAHISGGLQRRKIPLKAVHIADILDQQSTPNR